MTSIRQIPIDQIDVPNDRLRRLDPGAADALAASMDERGLMHPITVWMPRKGARLRLIAGLHRLTAAQRLGWAEITGSVFEGRALDARLLEIDENVFARRLSPLDQAAHLAERKRIYEELYPETKGGAAGGTARWHANEKFSFASDAAEKMGISVRLIQLSVARHTKIAPDVRAQIALTWIADKASELDALARLEPDLQRQAVAVLLDGEAKSVRQAVQSLTGQRPPTLAPEDVELDRLRAAWRQAGARARARWLAELQAAGILASLKLEAA